MTETAHWASSTQAVYSKHSIVIHSISILGGLCNRRTGCLQQTISVLFENYLLQFLRIFLLFGSSKHLGYFLDVLNKVIIAILCPNMINFDALDFIECRLEEVISFFWCSVYVAYWSKIWSELFQAFTSEWIW